MLALGEAANMAVASGRRTLALSYPAALGREDAKVYIAIAAAGDGGWCFPQNYYAAQQRRAIQTTVTGVLRNQAGHRKFSAGPNWRSAPSEFVLAYA